MCVCVREREREPLVGRSIEDEVVKTGTQAEGKNACFGLDWLKMLPQRWKRVGGLVGVSILYVYLWFF